MKILSVILVLGLASSALADSHEESLYVGIDKNGQACQVKISADINTFYVQRFENGSVTSFEPRPGFVEEVSKTFSIVGAAEDQSVNASGPLSELQAALNGDADELSAVGGGYFNAGLGRQSASVKFSQGRPVSAKFKFSYLFTSFKKSECLNLVKQ